MAAQSDLKINITATDQAGKKIKSITQDLNQLGSSSKKSGGLMAALTGPVGKATAALAGFGIAAKKAFDLAQAGAAISQTSQSFDMLMTKVGASSDHLDLLRTAAQGTVSDMQLMSSTATLLAGAQGELADQLAQSTPQLLEIAKAAQKLNPSLGDTTFLYDSLATGVKRASPMILDNLGLTIRIGEANEKYAEALGKTVEQLTADEQKQALLNETLRAGAVLIEQAGGNTVSATDKFNILNTTVANTTDRLKVMLFEGMEPYVDTAIEAAQATETFVDSLERTQRMEVFQEALAVANLNTVTFSRNTEVAKEQLLELGVQVAAVSAAVDADTKFRDGNILAIHAGTVERQVELQQLEDSQRMYQATGQVVNYVTKTTYDAADATEELGKTAKVTTDKAMKPYTISILEANAALGLAMDGSEDYMGLLREQMNKKYGLINVTDFLSDSLGSLDSMYNDVRNSGRSYTNTVLSNDYANGLIVESNMRVQSSLNATATGYKKVEQSAKSALAAQNASIAKGVGVIDAGGNLRAPKSVSEHEEVHGEAFSGAAGRKGWEHVRDVALDIKSRHQGAAQGDELAAWGGEFLRNMQTPYGRYDESTIQEGLLAAGFSGIRNAVHGFDGVIPPGFPNDSFMMGVSSGERVSVTPAHSTNKGGGNITIQNVYVQGVSTESQLYEKVQAAARQRGRDFARVM